MVVERRHAVERRDLRRQPGADGTVRVAHGIGQLHLFATLEHRLCVVQDLGVEAVGNGIAAAGHVEPALVVLGIDLGQDRVEIEVVEMFRHRG